MVPSNKLKRTKTNISGFDVLVEGGFPRGSNVLISGTPGSGKTIFSLQYIVEGALNENEFGIYFTFEERKKALITQAQQFGWDLEALEKEGKIKIISIGTDDIDKNTVNEIKEVIKNLKAKRVVIDSITSLTYLVGTAEATKEFFLVKFLHSFVTSFNCLENVTTLFISQKSSETSMIAAYICDGIVNFESESLGGTYSRNLSIKKMRSTKNNDELHPFEIVKEGGINVHSFN